MLLGVEDSRTAVENDTRPVIVCATVHSSYISFFLHTPVGCAEIESNAQPVRGRHFTSFLGTVKANVQAHVLLCIASDISFYYDVTDDSYSWSSNPSRS